jgi:hypothetical protein
LFQLAHMAIGERLEPDGELAQPLACSPDERSDIRGHWIGERSPGCRCAHPGYD